MTIDFTWKHYFFLSGKCVFIVYTDSDSGSSSGSDSDADDGRSPGAASKISSADKV